jgi:crotonobetainyl-CoA:carnitine CoA-transferase CaiB-like acyl-CoA transferase
VQALDNVVVLDLTHHIAGPYATKLMADFGADVIKVERPGGDIARYLGPFQGNEPNIEKSGLFFFLNTNKRSVTLDLAAEPARRAMAALAQQADIVVENFAPASSMVSTSAGTSSTRSNRSFR